MWTPLNVSPTMDEYRYDLPVDERTMTNAYRERDSRHFHYEICVTSCFFAEGVVRYDE